MKTTSTGGPVAIYARYSTDRQDARSIDDQVRRCRKFAEERHLTVSEVFKDAAQSGAYMERADLQRLLAAARSKPPPFQSVLVDDLSRLSRDLGNTWQIIFRDLAMARVSVVDTSTGMSSTAPGARLQFAALGIVNDAYLQIIRSETTRGLEGRALAGFWTGGRVYGYRTVKEANPPDPEHPRSVPVVDDDQAQVVLRIFRTYALGAGLKQVAKDLNADGILAPYDDAYGKKAGRGWGPGTIRAILRNERYVGRWTWKKREWVTHPETGARTARIRDEKEWLTREVPELVIVPADLWEQVQQRFAKRVGSRGRPSGTGSTGHLLAGMLRCGECGSTMRIVSARKKNGKTYANFGCSAHFGKGDAICPNNLTISEAKVNRAVIDSIREILASGEIEAQFAEAFRRRFDELPAETAQERERLEGELRAQDARVRNITQAMARSGYSEALGEQLRLEEETLGSLRRRHAALTPAASVPRPEPDAVLRFLDNALQIAEKAPREARDALSRLLSPVTLLPVTGPDGTRHYEARGALNTNPAALVKDGRVSVNDGCGGRI